MLTRVLLSNFKKIFLICLSPVFAGLFAFGLQSCDFLRSRYHSKTLLQVEDSSINVKDFSDLLARRLRDLDALSAKDPAIIKTFKNKIVTDYIIDQVIKLWAKENKLDLSSKDVDERIKKIMSSYPSDLAFREYLADEEISYNQWKLSVAVDLQREYLFKKLREKIPKPAEDELLSYYNNNKPKYFQNESVQAQSILVADENQADVIKKLYRKSPRFEELVKKYSLEKIDALSAKPIWIDRIPDSDLDILFTNKKVELIGPIQLSEGYRLFKVLLRRQSHQKKYEEVRIQVLSEVMALRESATFSSWLEEQIKRYKIYKNTQGIDALAVETREET